MRNIIAITLVFVLSLLPGLSLGEGVSRTQEKFNRSEDPTISGKVIMDLKVRGPVVSRSFYGAHLDSYGPAPATSLIQELGVGRLRMGGNEYDVYNWKNDFTLTQNGLRKLPGFVNTAKFLRGYGLSGVYQINLLGFQPENEGGRYVLRESFNAQAAGDLIRSLNGKSKLGIVDVSLGNEPEQWHETHPHTLARLLGRTGAISADEYVDRFIQYAMAIRQAQEEVSGDPNSIKIWGPEFSDSWMDWNTGEMTRDCQWHARNVGQVVCRYGNGRFDNFQPYFLDRIAKAEKDPAVNPRGYKLLDYYSFHYYATPRTKISDVKSIVADPEGRQWVSKILEGTRIFHDPTYINSIDKSSYLQIAPNIFTRMKAWRDSYYPKAKIGLNEFALDSDYRSTFYHPIIRPLYLADSMAIAAKEGLDFFNNFILSGPAGASTPWAMLDGAKKTRLFYSYSIISRNLLGTVIGTEDNMGDVVNSYAVDSGDSVVLVLINKSPLPQRTKIYLRSDSTAEKKLSSSLLPGWSISAFRFKKGLLSSGTTFDVSRYGAQEMGIPADPAYAKY